MLSQATLEYNGTLIIVAGFNLVLILYIFFRQWQMGAGGCAYLTNLPLPDSDQGSADKIQCPNVCKLSYRSL